MRRAANRLLWITLVVAGLLFLDQASKRLALQALGGPGATLHLVGPIDLTLVQNRSNAFGVVPQVGEISRWGLVLLNGFVGVFLVVWSCRASARTTVVIGMAVLAAGAFGNAIDRALLGYVIDFVDASKIGFRWVFNLADSLVDIGVALLLLSSVLHAREDARRSVRSGSV